MRQLTISTFKHSQRAKSVALAFTFLSVLSRTVTQAVKFISRNICCLNKAPPPIHIYFQKRNLEI